MGSHRRRHLDARLVVLGAGFLLAPVGSRAQHDDADDRGCLYHVVRGDFMIHVASARPSDNGDSTDILVRVAPRPTRRALARTFIGTVLTAGWWVPGAGSRRAEVASMRVLRDGGEIAPAAASVAPGQGGVYRYSALGFRANQDGSLPTLEVLVRAARGDDARVTIDSRAARTLARRAPSLPTSATR